MIPANLHGQALYNFVGGRRAYNAGRRFKALERRFQILLFWSKNPHLNKADLARHFGVHRSTVTRDIKRLKQDHQRFAHCPLCQGKGRIDTGPGAAVMAELISDATRDFGLFL